MPQQLINLGATGSGAGGDSARTAFEKAIANFAELYIAALPGTAAQKQAARDMFGLGTAATRAVQTGPNDTTTGALMAVGGGGVLQASTALIESAESWLGNRFKAWASASPGAPSTVVSVGLDTGYAQDRRFQMAITAFNELKFRYTADPTIASGWRTVFHAANILGTVSQSAGVPTGAIIERGSNANGEYVRFADGTQICWLTKTWVGVDIPYAHLGGFRSATQLWTYPSTFSASPSVEVVPFELTALSCLVNTIAAGSAGIVLTAVASQPSADRKVMAIAVGRWY